MAIFIAAELVKQISLYTGVQQFGAGRFAAILQDREAQDRNSVLAKWIGRVLIIIMVFLWDKSL